MKIHPKKLLSWLNSKFPYVKESGHELEVNSVFEEDTKHHLSLNWEKGVYHCWKSEKAGPIWQLVCLVDKCSRDEAIEKVYQDEADLSKFDETITYLKGQNGKTSKQVKDTAKLPKHYKDLTAGGSQNVGVIGQKAMRFFDSRKILPWKYQCGYCYDGEYEDRIILPVYNQTKELIYWTSRTLKLKDDREQKYKNPPKNLFSVNKSDVVWFYLPLSNNTKVYICEGIFNAMSLVECGLTAVAILGKTISSAQIEQIKHCGTFVLSLDNDRGGIQSIMKNVELLRRAGLESIKVVCPPDKGQDWNEMYRKLDKDTVLSYIQKSEQEVDFNFQVNFLLSNPGVQPNNGKSKKMGAELGRGTRRYF